MGYAPPAHLWVIWGKWLLITGLHDGNLLSHVIHEEIRATQPFRGCLRVLTGTHALDNGLDQTPHAWG